MSTHKKQNIKDLENLRKHIKIEKPITILKEENSDNYRVFELEEKQNIKTEIEDSTKIYKDKQVYKRKTIYPRSGLI